MNRNVASSNLARARVALLLLVFSAALLVAPVRAQQNAGLPSSEKKTTPTASDKPSAGKTTAAQKPDERAEKVLEKAIEAAGGSAFLGVRTVVARGYFTEYKDGVSSPLTSFNDYLAFPDRERTEFKTEGIRAVQTYTGEVGWVFEGMTKKVSDMKPEQMKDFQIAMRTSLDNLLRGWWRKEGAQLTYAGRREGGLARRNDAVRLTYPDGFVVDFEFGAKDALHYKTIYKRQNKDGDEVEEEDRMAKHLAVNGVVMAHVIDHYRAGTQTSRINYEAIEFNRPLPDSLFARPTDAKALLKSLK